MQKSQDDVYSRIKGFNSSLSQVLKELQRWSEQGVSGEWAPPPSAAFPLPVMSDWCHWGFIPSQAYPDPKEKPGCLVPEDLLDAQVKMEREDFLVWFDSVLAANRLLQTRLQRTDMDTRIGLLCIFSHVNGFSDLLPGPKGEPGRWIPASGVTVVTVETSDWLMTG